MAYTPHTWTAGETIDAAKLNANEQGTQAAAAAADTANTALAAKVNSSTYTAGLAGKADLPAGGTDGQSLVKSGSTTAWATVSAGGTVSDASTTAKGVVQLAGDLAGTAAAPTVPGLAGKLAAANNLSDVANAATARTNLGLGTAATSASTAFDASGAAAAAQAAAVQRANHTGTQAATTITGLSTVATSGAYTDLTAKPTIPTVGAAGAGAAVALSSTDASVTNARTPTAHTHPASDLTATGTRDATTFLRGDNTWAAPAGGGATTGVASGMFVVTDATYGAKGDGTTDDTTAIQNAITAAQAVHGTVYLPRGLYKTTAALTVSAGIQIVGEGCVPLYGSIATDFNTINVPVAAPYLAGAVLMPSTAGQNAITITGAGVTVHMEKFGIRFADAIKFTNTGHGIQYIPPVISGQTYRDNGLIDSTWHAITVFGHDGNHYAYYLTNPIYNTLSHLRSFGGGVLFMENNGRTGASNAQYYGNMLVEHIYGQVFLSGTAHGIRLANTSNQLNLLAFNRPQITCAPMTTTFAGTTGPSNTTGQQMFNADQFVRRLSIIAPDFETNSNCTVAFPNSGSAQFIAPGLINFGSGSTTYVAMATEGNKQISQDLNPQDTASSGTRTIHSIAGTGNSIAVDTATAQAQFFASIKPKGYATGSRPSASTHGAGAQIFDTTLNKPIWSNGTAWVDASGAVV